MKVIGNIVQKHGGYWGIFKICLLYSQISRIFTLLKYEEEVELP